MITDESIYSITSKITTTYKEIILWAAYLSHGFRTYSSNS